jgi:hypothetical protein
LAASWASGLESTNLDGAGDFTCAVLTHTAAITAIVGSTLKTLDIRVRSSQPYRLSRFKLCNQNAEKTERNISSLAPEMTTSVADD